MSDGSIMLGLYALAVVAFLLAMEWRR